MPEVDVADAEAPAGSDYGNPDPEVNTTGNNNFSRGSDFNTQPPARRFVLTFRTSY